MCLVIAVVVFVASYFSLPAIQSLMLPKLAASSSGPWLVRPIIAFHFGACAVSTVAAMPVFMAPLRRRWRAADVADGTRYDPFHGRPVAKASMYVKGTLLLLVYASAMAFYLFSWQIVDAHGITQRLPWGTTTYGFGRVAALECIPEGFRSDSLKQEGPHYSLALENGRTFTFDLDNEGMTEARLETITSYIRDQVGGRWEVRPDARRLR